jgi:hypothetical protein
LYLRRRRIAIVLSKSGHQSYVMILRGRDIMRRLIPVTGVMALLVLFDRSFVCITEGDPIIKVLLGAGVIFFVWLFLLWDDLVQSNLITADPDNAAGKDAFKVRSLRAGYRNISGRSPRGVADRDTSRPRPWRRHRTR